MNNITARRRTVLRGIGASASLIAVGSQTVGGKPDRDQYSGVAYDPVTHDVLGNVSGKIKTGKKLKGTVTFSKRETVAPKQLTGSIPGHETVPAPKIENLPSGPVSESERKRLEEHIETVEKARKKRKKRRKVDLVGVTAPVHAGEPVEEETVDGNTVASYEATLRGSFQKKGVPTRARLREDDYGIGGKLVMPTQKQRVAFTMVPDSSEKNVDDIVGRLNDE